MVVKFAKINSTAKIPEFKTSGSAGADLYTVDGGIIKAGETQLFHLGIKSEFPNTLVGLIYPRSGLATKSGLAPANKVGVIDSDYRGEWMVALHNHSKEDAYVEPGDRIAQVVFATVPEFTVEEVDENDLTDTERGEGGFGSTKMK